MVEVVALWDLFDVVIDKTKDVIIPSYCLGSITSPHTQVKVGSGAIFVEVLLKNLLFHVFIVIQWKDNH
jgi:hypothetical protein